MDMKKIAHRTGWEKDGIEQGHHRRRLQSRPQLYLRIRRRPADRGGSPYPNGPSLGQWQGPRHRSWQENFMEGSRAVGPLAVFGENNIRRNTHEAMLEVVCWCPCTSCIANPAESAHQGSRGARNDSMPAWVTDRYHQGEYLKKRNNPGT